MPAWLCGGHLPLPTDQIRFSAPDSATLLRHAQQPIGRDGLDGTLDLSQLRFAEIRSAINEPCCRRAGHHLTRRGHRFHSLGHRDLFADGGVAQRPGTDLPGDHLTGVKSS
jgi:hypothetical protein